jgi:lipoate-protein ligase A
LVDVSWIPYESAHPSPARNLAWEDALLETRARGASVFLVYRNDPCVVIGRNQNPWREALTGGGFPVFRRRSGGGTVYHDGGNLNWSFMMDRDAWVVQDALDFVGAALRRLGVEPVRDPRGALFLEGRKICGTARRYFGPSVLIHGTLLVSSDLEALGASLAGIPSAIDRAVASVPSPVGNLSEALPGLTVQAVRDALFAELEARYGAPEPRDPGLTLPESAWSDREREHGSWDWVFGATLPFTVPLGPGGTGPFLRVREGRADRIQASRDCPGDAGSGSGPWAGELPEGWEGRPFDAALLEELRERVNQEASRETPGGEPAQGGSQTRS